MAWALVLVRASANSSIKSLPDVDPEMPLLWAVRDVLGLKGTKYGCGRALCGACSLHVDGKLFRSMKFAGLPWARATTSGLLSFTVDDVYGLPIDKLGALLNAARDRALADTPQSQALENSMTAGLARDGRALGFQKNPARIGAVGWAVTIAGFAWVLLAAVVFLGWPSDVAVDMEGWAHSPGQWLQRFAVLLVPIALIAELLILMREIMPADNALTLDRDGLTLIRGGSKKAWPWRDLTGFEVTFREVLGLFGPRGVIVFGTPGGRDLRSRFLRWCYRLSGRAPAMVLEDIYDTPLDDIAATLNRYRAEGAGGGAAD